MMKRDKSITIRNKIWSAIQLDQQQPQLLPEPKPQSEPVLEPKTKPQPKPTLDPKTKPQPEAKPTLEPKPQQEQQPQTSSTTTFSVKLPVRIGRYLVTETHIKALIDDKWTSDEEHNLLFYSPKSQNKTEPPNVLNEFSTTTTTTYEKLVSSLKTHICKQTNKQSLCMYLQTIHAYMTFLCERSNGRCLFVQSGFIDQVRRRKYDAAKRWLGRSTVKIFVNKDHSVGVTQMFFPINLNNQHRVLGVVDLRKKQSSVLDSLAGDHSRRIEVIRFIIFYPPPIFPQQQKNENKI